MSKKFFRFSAPLVVLIALLMQGTQTISAQSQMNRVRTNQRLTPRDSIRLSDPCILADSASQTYYMTGTGGMLWTSKDLNQWEGP